MINPRPGFDYNGSRKVVQILIGKVSHSADKISGIFIFTPPRLYSYTPNKPPYSLPNNPLSSHPQSPRMQFSFVTILSLAALAVAAPSHMTRRQADSYAVQACIDYNFEGHCTEIQGSYCTCIDVPAKYRDAISSLAADRSFSWFAFVDEGCNGRYFQITANTQMPHIPAKMDDAIFSILC